MTCASWRMTMWGTTMVRQKKVKVFTKVQKEKEKKVRGPESLI
jgi:hypothetical protein